MPLEYPIFRPKTLLLGEFCSAFCFRQVASHITSSYLLYLAWRPASQLLPTNKYIANYNKFLLHADSAHTAANGHSIIHTAIPMGIVIILTSNALIIVTILLVKSRLKVQTLLMERKAKEKMQIYEDIDLSQIIDSIKNIAYETPSQVQIHCMHSWIHNIKTTLSQQTLNHYKLLIRYLCTVIHNS